MLVIQSLRAMVDGLKRQLTSDADRITSAASAEQGVAAAVAAQFEAEDRAAAALADAKGANARSEELAAQVCHPLFRGGLVFKAHRLCVSLNSSLG